MNEHEVGSFDWYESSDSKFLKNLSLAIMHADNENLKYNKTGNSGMTIGGTGDVLAGLCAGFLAQTKELFNSAYYAAYLNGAVGDYLLKQKGIGFTASDMVELIPMMKKRLKI